MLSTPIVIAAGHIYFMVCPMKISIIGSGMAGCTAAVLLRELGHQVTVFEQRDHIGGNCHDEWDQGVLVHRYGPHGFHTNTETVWRFVNRFTRFHPTALEVVANTSMGVVPIPFNDISAQLIGDLAPESIRDLIFRAYSEKHWGIPWEEVPQSITGRLPERRRSSDRRYHLDRWQGTPKEGYAAMFKTMLDGIEYHTGCEQNAWRRINADHVIFTGSIDEYFDYRHGRLEYRSLSFQYQRALRRNEFQINECNRINPWTRSVDHSHWLDQKVDTTIIGYEFPCEWEDGMVRMYPKPFGLNPERYRKYKTMADAEKGVTFLGRLATYKYLDMDDVIAQAMNGIRKLCGRTAG